MIKPYYTIIFLLSLFFSVNFAFASQMRDFETTRLKSTAGAGVGSVLMDESTILNPAPLAFFDLTSIYIQKGSAERVSPMTNNQASISESSDQLGVIASDAKGSAAGSLSFTKSSVAQESRKRLSTSLAYRVDDASSIGLSYKMTEDNFKADPLADTQVKKYKTISAGIFHVFDNGFSFGLLAEDPQNKGPYGNRGTAGMQYVFKNFLTFVSDIGANYKSSSFSDTLFYKIGAQFSLFKDIYLRIGTSYDKGMAEKAQGIGLSWIQPRLMLDFAIKNTTLLQKESIQQTNSKTKESSFALSYRF